jgi:UDP-3-O-[3-hydroxymyristoyl] glucosamine N-acyltransferase
MVLTHETTLGVLAREIGGELDGDEGIVVRNISDIEEAKEGDVAFVMRKENAQFIGKTKASCVIVPSELKTPAPVPVIACKNANLAFKKAAEIIFKNKVTHPGGIHRTASIGERVTLGTGVAVGAYAVVEDGASIGDGTVVYAHSYIGFETKIGKNCLIYPNVTLRENVTIGDRVIINPGSVIGSDGFGYERTPKGYEKIPHIGDIVIEDDVELGACVTVDRAKIAHTRIGRGTKIDNLVQIAHNVTIGQNCIIIAQCGISGSVKIGNNVIMAGQVGLVDHIEIGDNVIIGAQAGVMKSIPANTVAVGSPARPARKTLAIVALLEKLPEMYKKLKAIEKKLGLH